VQTLILDKFSIPTARDRITLRALCECLSDVFPEARLKLPHTVMDSEGGIAREKILEYARLILNLFYLQLITHL
jgi:hypothetical protein